MAKKRRDEGGGDDWLNTYADMVTLLLTFFAVLLSMSSVDQQKFNAFIRSFSNLPQEVIEEITAGPLDELDIEKIDYATLQMDDLYSMLKDYVAQSNQTENIEVFKVDGVLYIRFNSSLFFEPDQYVLRTESLPVLKFIGDGLKNYEPYIKMINVLGFTATVQNGTYWMLSGERSAVVADFFSSDCGFDAEKLTVIGYGNRYPVDTNDTEEGRKKNRRVELVVVGNSSPDDFNISDSLDKLYGEKSVDTLDEAFAQNDAVEKDMVEEFPPMIKSAMEAVIPKGAVPPGGDTAPTEDIPPAIKDSLESTAPVEENVSPYEE